MDNETLYRSVQRTLVVGMILSFGLMGLGLILVLATGRNGDLVALADLPGAIGRFEPGALIAVGVLLLMFIPAIHLLVMLSWFLRRGERRYVIIAAIVLLLLAVGAALPLIRPPV